MDPHVIPQDAGVAETVAGATPTSTVKAAATSPALPNIISTPLGKTADAAHYKRRTTHPVVDSPSAKITRSEFDQLLQSRVLHAA
jgi:hypothetical protein